MRIIGGKLKGKKLLFLKSSATRPLRDMVREGIFNVIDHSNLLSVKIKNSNECLRTLINKKLILY